ncbi:MAG: hypothetical protein SAJ12_11100, partial [Jaaginema sp. PMC 1079.18]|nr:hypothetical protein [Jaaginema sp. PMC 1079.18]MEC4869136.1 hypothetical protein [Jaaginema sp. PMC 1078.18]
MTDRGKKANDRNLKETEISNSSLDLQSCLVSQKPLGQAFLSPHFLSPLGMRSLIQAQHLSFQDVELRENLMDFPVEISPATDTTTANSRIQPQRENADTVGSTIQPTLESENAIAFSPPTT